METKANTGRVQLALKRRAANLLPWPVLRACRQPPRQSHTHGSSCCTQRLVGKTAQAARPAGRKQGSTLQMLVETDQWGPGLCGRYLHARDEAPTAGFRRRITDSPWGHQALRDSRGRRPTPRGQSRCWAAPACWPDRSVLQGEVPPLTGHSYPGGNSTGSSTLHSPALWPLQPPPSGHSHKPLAARVGLGRSWGAHADTGALYANMRGKLEWEQRRDWTPGTGRGWGSTPAAP